MVICSGFNCKKQPSYNFANEKNPLCCKTHSLPGMIDVRNIKCKTCHKSRANYNKIGYPPLYCSKCATSDMIDLTHPKCNELGCNVRPTYNLIGNKKALYCEKHKKDNMVNVVSKTCLEPNCNTQPNYNYKGNKTALYCKFHAKKDMVDITHKKCLEPNCMKQPSCNFPGEKIRLYCSLHKKIGMVDIISKLCQEPNCNLHPNFNYDGQLMGIYCKMHKKTDMIDVEHNKCKTPLCGLRVKNNKYNGYCLRCFIYMFPDEKVSRNYKTKEKYVSDYIKEKFPDKLWIIDKIIQGGCSSRRPDILLDCGTHILIIEIDENQHNNYDSICEHKRTMQICQDLGFMNIVFLRFNPDSYIRHNIIYPSCWKTNQKGILVIKKDMKKIWIKRLNRLCKEIAYWLITIPEKQITIGKLYYDKN
jgi:hypothetical protein